MLEAIVINRMRDGLSLINMPRYIVLNAISIGDCKQ